MFQYLILDDTIFRELDDTDAAFIAYVTMHGKNYKTIEEYTKRKGYFMNSINLVANQSLMHQSYVMGINHMSDWTTEEYYKILGVVPEGKYPIEIIEGDFDDEDEDDKWKNAFENQEWSDINSQANHALENPTALFSRNKKKDKKNNFVKKVGGGWPVSHTIDNPDSFP